MALAGHIREDGNANCDIIQICTGWVSISRTDFGMALCVYEWKFC